MKILFTVHQYFPKHYTGTERFVLNLSKQMQKMGHYVKILTYGITESEGFRQDGDFLIKEYVFQGVPVISIKHEKNSQELNFSIYDTKMAQILDKILSNEKFDIVHVCHPMRLGSIVKVAKDRNIPIVLTLTDFWLMCPRGIAVTINGDLCNGPDKGAECINKCYNKSWESKIIQRFYDANEFINNINVLISPTYFLAGLLKNTFNREINVVRHGTEYSVIKPNKKIKTGEEAIIFGYIGTVLPHKGVHIITKAFSLIKDNNIKIKIYGTHFNEKEYYESLKKMALLDNRIELSGEFKDEELNSIMSGVDCIIAPSIWWENSPLTVLTSLAYKVPVITINVGGAAELVKDGINGFNFQIGDSESLANVIEKIARNPDILNEIKENIIRPPRVEEEAFEYEKIYSKLLKEVKS